jgi:hypothetical protein
MSDTANQAIGIPDAAAAIEGILAGDTPDNENADTANEASKPAEDSAEPLAADAGEETAVEESADAPEEAAPDAEEADGASESGQQLVTVTIDGKTEQLPVEEVAKGYQRQQDYSRKTMALAEERKVLHGEYQAVVQERAQYQQLLSALSQQWQQAQQAEPDWQKLYDSDPLEYVRQKDIWRDRQEKLAASAAEFQRLQHLQSVEQQKQIAQIVEQGRQKLPELVPEWKDAKRWEADRAKILQYGQKVGYSQEELAQAYDPRAVAVMYKAMRYDEMVSKTPRPVVNRGPKSAPAGSANSTPRTTSELTKAKQRLAATGRQQDAAAIFERFL